METLSKAKHRILSALLAVCIVVSVVVPMTAVPVSASTSNGIDSDNPITISGGEITAQSGTTSAPDGTSTSKAFSKTPTYTDYTPIVKAGDTETSAQEESVPDVATYGLSYVNIIEDAPMVDDTFEVAVDVTAADSSTTQTDMTFKILTVSDGDTMGTVQVGIGEFGYSAISREISGGITIPDTVTYKGESFKVTAIGVSAFWQCPLTDLTIPEGITTIGNYAFGNCMLLKTLHIPSSVTPFDGNVFDSCFSLTTITVTPGSAHYTSEDGILFSADKTTLVKYPASITTTSYTIPEGVKTIAYSAFHAASNLTSVKIPNSVTTIENNAFYGCTDLTSVIIPNSVETVGSFVFDYCEALKSISFGSGLTNLDEDVFDDDPSYITYPALTAVYFGGDYHVTDTNFVTGVASIPDTVAIYYNSVADGWGDVSDAIPVTVTLGETLTYNGEEQTQSVASVQLGTDAPITSGFDVTNNTVTAPGDYELTVMLTDKQFAITKAFSVTERTYDEFAYIDENGDSQMASNPTEITNATTALGAGWYVVNSAVTLDETLTIDGDAHLILADGGSLNVTSDEGDAISGGYGVSLTIYGQTAGTGSLTATSTASKENGIYFHGATLTINGGTVNFEGDSSGIYAQDITINGGTVYTEGGSSAISLSSFDNVSATINGGDITAISKGSHCFQIISVNAAALMTVNGGTVDVSGGTINGIFVSGNLGLASITINGGEVTTEGYNNGIQCQTNTGSASVTINGGELNTIGTNNNGIFMIGNATPNSVTINGGEVSIYGESKAIYANEITLPLGMKYATSDNEITDENANYIMGNGVVNANDLDSYTIVREITSLWTDIATTPEGAGSASSPYQIKDGADLAWVANQVNSGNNFAGEYIILTDNIDLAGNKWTPIGNSSNYSFAGAFDGVGYEIANMYIDMPDSDYVGLFGYVYDGTIKNVVVSGAVTGKDYVGGVVGNTNNGMVINSNNSGTITGEDFVGGVVGYNFMSEVINSNNSGTITGEDFVGGVVGYNDTSEIINSYNSGTITGVSSVGGIAGYNTAIDYEIINSYNSGTITGASSVGGVVGYNSNDSTVTNSYWLDSSAPKGIGTDNEGNSDVESFNSDGDFADDSRLLTALSNWVTTYNADPTPEILAREWEVATGVNDGFPKFAKMAIPVGDISYTNSITYGDSIPKATLPEGHDYGAVNITYAYTDESGDPVATPENVGIYNLTITIENDNYIGTKVTILEIGKATPSADSYTVPSNLTATYGETLADVTLPNEFAFEDASATSVGNVGDNTFSVTYTPSDTTNYNHVTGIQVTIAVGKADQDELTITSLAATYGTNLTLQTSGGSTSGAVTYEVTDGTGSATISNGVLTPTSVGTVTVTATKAGGSNYNDVSSVATTITIAQAEKTGVNQSLNAANDLAKTYTFDLNEMLPTLSDDLSFGDVRYEIVGATGATSDMFGSDIIGRYADISSDGILALTVLDVGGVDLRATLSISITTDNYNFADTVDLIVETVDRTPLEIDASITSRAYDGTPLAYEGTPTFADLSGVAVTGVTFKAEYVGRGETTYTKSTTAPTNAGSYDLVLTISGDSEGYYVGTQNIGFEITKVDATVTADDNRARVGTSEPQYTFSQSGFVNGETIDGVILSETVDMNKAGEYTIIPSGGTVSGGGNDNYNITYTAGKMYVTVDAVELDQAITDALGVQSGVSISDGAPSSVEHGEKFVSTAVSKALNDAIEDAYNAILLTQADLTNAVNTLKAAQTAFEDAIKIGTKTVSDGQTNVDIDVVPSTSGDTASANVPDEDLKTAVQDALDDVKGTNNTPKITIDVDTTSGTQEVKVTLNSTELEKLAENKNAALEINSGVGSMIFDSKAISAVAKAAGSAEISVVMRKVENKNELTEEQRKVVGDAPIYELYIESNGKRISDFNGGTVTVKVPEELQIGENSKLTVYYLADDGSIEEVEAVYDSKAKTVTFVTKHFSYYVIQVTTIPEGTDVPETGDSAPIEAMLLAMALTIAGMYVLVNNRKKIMK